MPGANPAAGQPAAQLYNVPGYTQPVYVQPVYVQPQAPIDTAGVPSPPANTNPPVDDFKPETTLIIVSHSQLFYWWPVWVVGYMMALITAMNGVTMDVNGNPLRVFPSSNMGIFFMMTLFMVIMISNVLVRGLASTIVILSIVLATVVFAYLGWWDDIFAFFGGLNIYINQGAYFWFSTLLFLVWAGATFIFDRFSYWRVTPGQMTQVVVFGASSKAFDTENMSVEKRRDDVFRHWILGIGSGDLVIHAFNAGQRVEIHIPNVLFVGSKVAMIHQLVAMEPTMKTPHAAGSPAA
jgi:hypothetical protein